MATQIRGDLAAQISLDREGARRGRFVRLLWEKISSLDLQQQRLEDVSSSPP